MEYTKEDCLALLRETGRTLAAAGEVVSHLQGKGRLAGRAVRADYHKAPLGYLDHSIELRDAEVEQVRRRGVGHAV